MRMTNKQECSVSGCERQSQIRGRCIRHFRQAGLVRCKPTMGDEATARKAMRDAAHFADLEANPAAARVAAMSRTPRYMFDPAPETQAELIDAIDAIPIEMRRIALKAPIHRDPLYRIACDICEAGRHGNATLTIIGWLYGVTRQRIDQTEKVAMAKLRMMPKVRDMHASIGEEADHAASSHVSRIGAGW